MKRFMLSFLFLMLAVILILPHNASAAEADVTVYVDSVNGSSANDGLTEKTAVSTIKEGYAALHTTMTNKGLNLDTSASGKIVIVNDYRYAEFTTASKTRDAGAAAHKYHVTITGKAPETVLEFYLPTQCTYGLRGPTTIENICIRLTEDSQSPYLTITNHSGKLTIGQGVTTSDYLDRKPCLTAAPYFTTSVSHLSIEINSGAWRNIYAGVYTSTATSTCSLVMNGGSADKIGTSYNGTITGDVSITINGGSVAELVTGPVNKGKINGNVAVTINGGSITRSVHATLAGTISGTLTTTLAPSNTVTLTNCGEVSVNNLTAGTIDLQSGASLVVTDSVTGPVNIALSSDVSYGTYLTVPSTTANDAVTFTGGQLEVITSGNQKIWQCDDLTKLKGLVLQAPTGVTVNLYTGLAKGATTKVTPAITQTENGIVSRYYPNLAVGSYHYVASGTGYYTVDKDIYFSTEKAATKTVINADPGKKSGKLYEATTTIFSPTDEFKAAVIPSAVSMWPEYADALTTPMFTDTPRAAQAYTSYDELIAVLEELVAENENMYLYYLGKTHKYDIDIPLVIFTETNLSGAKTLEEAAALVVANEKLTVHYQGLMHGNEPAGGEGALAVTKLLATDYGDALIGNMNIYVIPWLSPAGAQDDRRMIPGTQIDPNRDMLRVETSEIQLHHYAYELFQPEVSMDSHEFTVDPSSDVTGYNDMMLAAGFTANNSQEFINLSTHLTTLPFVKLRQQGLRPTYYLQEVNFNNPNNGSSYAGNRGILYVLIESRGIYGGHDAYARRTVGHVITATEVLNYVHNNAETVQATVDAEKARIAALGATYEETDLIVLEHGPVEHKELSYNIPRFDGATGAWKSDGLTIPKAMEEIVRSRVKPTAYVIPAGETWTNSVLDRLDKHFVEYTFIPAGQAIKLQQYGGTTSEATLSEEQVFTFENGAYVITMDTYYANVIATMFEPDVTDSAEFKGTLVQSGLIPATGDTYPVYRYIHDLNVDGSITTYTPVAAPEGLQAVNPAFIGGTGSITGLKASLAYEYRSSAQDSYTALPVGTTAIENLQIGTYYVRLAATDGIPSADAVLVISYGDIQECTVYLCASTGSDSNNGYTESTPVATMAKAFSQLDLYMETASDNSCGKIVLLSDYALGNKAFTFPAHDYHVTLTANQATTQIIKGGSSTQTDCTVNISGPMTIDHITLTITSVSNFNNLNANGHRVIIGKDIICKANSKGAYFMLAGGGWNEVASTNLTVLGGNWEYVYPGGYTGSVKGNAKVVLKDTTIRQQIMATYNAASIGGDVYFDLENVSAPVLYGAMAKNKATDTASKISGNIYISLGKNVTIPTIYAGSRDSGNVSGVVTVIQAGADLRTITLHPKNKTSGSFGGCILSNADGSVLKLLSDVTGAYTLSGTLLLDLAGFNFGNATVTGTISAMDSASDGFTDTANGKLTCTIAESGSILPYCTTSDSQVGARKSYLAIVNEDGSYSFHRFSLAITKLSMVPATGSMGYKAVFYGSDTVKNYLDSEDAFGYKLWVTEDKVITKGSAASAFVSGQELRLRIDNFLSLDYSEDVNAANAQTDVYASVYLRLKTGQVIESSIQAYSLRDLVEQANTRFTTYTQVQQQALIAFVADYRSIMKDWAIDNIK